MSLVELMQMHVTEAPIPPSHRMNVQISEELESIILGCLEKSRARRPQTARDLAQQLIRCSAANDWKLVDAETWWMSHDRRRTQATDGLKSIESTARSLFNAPATGRQSVGSPATVSNPNASMTEVTAGVTTAKTETPSSSSGATKVGLGFDQTMVQDPESNGELT